MIKIEHLAASGFKHAIRGMRNPMNSWDKSDSKFVHGKAIIGEKDLELMKKLYKGGPEHRKYARQIFVSVDITAPLYWWKEFDTYKVGTVANSCSTMHKIAAKPFVVEDFSVEHLTEGNLIGFKYTLNCLNTARQNYLETKDKIWWWQMIQVLPSSYNQKRTVTMNYENVFSILHQRSNHKLDEWHILCDALRQLPYIKEIME